MTPSFSIDVDPAESIVRIVMAGFFGPADICRFVEAVKTAHLGLRCGANEHCTLVDIRDMSIQSQATVDAFAALIADPAHASRRIAFVVAVGLARAQIRRAAADRGAYFAPTIEEAEAWLQTGSAQAYASVYPVQARSTGIAR